MSLRYAVIAGLDGVPKLLSSERRYCPSREK
jgi:hypothetical protein